MTWLIYRYEEPMRMKFGTWFNMGEMEVNYGMMLDSLSMMVMVPVGIVTLCVLMYAMDYMRHDPNRNRFYIMLSVFAMFMTVLVVSENYLMMFIGWEFVGVVSYLLMSFWNTRMTAMKSGLSAITLNRMGDTFFVICLGILFNVYHAVDFETVELLTPHVNTNMLNMMALTLLLAATAKSAQLGLHGWLLSAMEGLVKRATIKFHYMSGHPNMIWSSILMYNNMYINTNYSYVILEKSKLSLMFNLLKYGQYSGNHNKGSSETLRETFNSYKHPYLTNTPFNYIDFIYWLMGFTEGNGSFMIYYNKERNKNYLEFNMTQSSNDVQMLYYIKKQLGMGTMSKQDKKSNTHQYKMRNKEGLLKMINMFNGKLYLNKTQNKFKEFVKTYNELYNTNMEVLDNNNEPTLDNAWLSGFTDAEGCFTLGFYRNKYFSIRYIISQKYENIFMNKLAILLNGNLSTLKECNTVNLTVNYLKLIYIIKYFNKYKLKTKKLIIYNNWLSVYYSVKNKEHKNMNKMDNMMKRVNKKYKV
uniref:Endonuclease, NAD5 group I intron encoded n=1 Tax=Pichia sorbitophila (strain ATCC MYA-4447 / BCRC 22081 / CBS 7064 / NBRC 10061 / NRRL Y-12695) TaxID=559304 RepID=C7U024_PICSO|nr:endonuclease [Millerozyma farinosa]CAY39280.1 Endonuclease, NAD5 group I intron encoded [Millerozyma farinosa]